MEYKSVAGKISAGRDNIVSASFLSQRSNKNSCVHGVTNTATLIYNAQVQFPLIDSRGPIATWDLWWGLGKLPILYADVVIV